MLKNSNLVILESGSIKKPGPGNAASRSPFSLKNFLFMKKLSLITVCVACIFGPVFSQKTSAKKGSAEKITVDLAEAISQKWVELEAVGLGGHRGEKVKLVCKNRRGSALRLKIQAGQLLLPGDENQQTLVVAEEKTVAISLKTPAEILLKTFCTEPGEASPTTGMNFTVGLLAAENVRKMLEFLSKSGKMEAVEAQSAIWSVCEKGNFSVGGIGETALTAEACRLLNRPVPGYRINYETRETPGQAAFSGKALVVDGNYKYVLAKDEKLTMTLFDADGKAIKVLSKDRPATAGEHRSSLHLEVRGLKQGRYFWRLTTQSGEVVKEEELEF